MQYLGYSYIKIICLSEKQIQLSILYFYLLNQSTQFQTERMTCAKALRRECAKGKQKASVARTPQKWGSGGRYRLLEAWPVATVRL